jgi:imidazolonepropionase-like amidohydrolase
MMRKLVWTALLFIVSAIFFLLASDSAFGQDLALVGGTVYPAPGATPIPNAIVLVHDGKIADLRSQEKMHFDKATDVIDCKGKFIVAGFWNSHVHFETGWHDVDKQTAQQLETHMQEMLTRWGFTTVWDLGSLPSNTLTLRHRIEAGEVPGPKILMAGDIFPKNGHPVYLPPEMQLPEAATADDATRMAHGYLSMGLDGIKLFTGSYMGNKPVINMDTAIVKAAVDMAHELHKPVFAHPQNHTGVDNALNGGVDILAHTIPTEGSFTADELAQMKRQHTALIPTLTLWTTVTPNVDGQKQLVDAGVSELKSYFDEGGTILFGTDVGFTSNYDTTQEFEFMGRAMPWKDVLASLTTNPSEYFKSTSQGRVEKGMDADLVVLDADPAADVRNLAKVTYTIRSGKIIYSTKQ